jgi:predicted polyphosphate/ATP-dependent NAD kinase
VTRLGLIVNPIAGMGGRVALKGTDGVVEEARARGAVPTAAERAERTLTRLERCRDQITLVAAPGPMGADLTAAHSFTTEVLPGAHAGVTTAADTRAAAAELRRRAVDLLLFAGGDGTTRDIHDVVGERLPILGIPTGVKMHSGVFAATPEHAGDVACSYAAAPGRAELREAEVVDVDEEALRRGTLTTRLYGAARVPADRLRVQPTKAAAAASDAQALDAVCSRIADAMDPRRVYLLGPGTTTRRIMAHLGLPKTLLGIDAVRAGSLLAADLTETQLLELLAEEPATLLVGIVGGQGALFGRGNQQLSAAVLRRLGLDNIEIVAGLQKLLSLDPPVLHVDTGDPALDAALAGYRRIHVAPGRTLVTKVVA